MNADMTRREFTSLWTLIVCLLAGPKAMAYLAEETDNTSWWQGRISDATPDDWNALEKAFAETWKEWNKPNRFDGGIAQMLMWSTYQHERPKDFDPELSPRERKILATFIQWLGTNVGGGFLCEVSQRAGCREYPFKGALESIYQRRSKRLKAEHDVINAKFAGKIL